MQICPNCGGFVETLLPITGWCKQCTAEYGIQICTICDRQFKSRTGRPTCSSCREELWLTRNADKLEEHMIKGLDFKTARKLVMEQNSPMCLGCGTRLPKIGYFCTSNTICRKLYVKYKNLRIRKGMTTQEALREALK